MFGSDALHNPSKRPGPVELESDVAPEEGWVMISSLFLSRGTVLFNAGLAVPEGTCGITGSGSLSAAAWE